MTQPVLPYPKHFAKLMVLGLPLAGGHLAQVAIGATDTLMVGWYGVTELAALTVAHSIFFSLFLVGAGFAWAVMPIIAEANAREDHTLIRRATRMGLWLSIAFALAVLPVLWFSAPLLRAVGQEEDVAVLAQSYLRIVAPGMVPALMVMTLKSFLAALERTQVIFWITVTAAILNAVVNYALIFGNWGVPELGIAGAAIASNCVQLASLVGVVIYIRASVPGYALFARFWRPDPEQIARVYRMGWPIGLTSLSETSLFTISALMMGWLGTVPLAAHGIAIQVASASFVIHLGLSNAATVRLGNAIGRSDIPNLRRGAVTAFFASVIVSVATAVVFLAAPEPIIEMFLDPEEPDRFAILAIGVGLLAMAALFQLADGGQIIALGLLRGAQDTRVPMILAAISYWGVGFPAAYLLGFTFELGGIGVWAGLVLGLALACLLLTRRFWNRIVPRLAAAVEA